MFRLSCHDVGEIRSWNRERNVGTEPNGELAGDPAGSRSPGAAAQEGRRWLVLEIPAPRRGEELLLIEALRSVGAREVSRAADRYTALIPEPGDLDSFLLRARSVIRASTSLTDAVIDWHWRGHPEWAKDWADKLEVRRLGEHIVVAPVGKQLAADPGDMVIRLVAGTAFGTAEHATTRGCLALLEAVVRRGAHVADIGAGSGILAVAAARLGAARVMAYELDEQACKVAEENVAANGVQDAVTVQLMEVRPGDLARAGPFDGIVANLQTDILLPLLPDVGQALGDGGWAIVSGITEPERREVLTAARAKGMEPAAELLEEGWWTSSLRRRG